MNARREPTIAVSMPSVQIRSGLITALAIVDFKEMAGCAKMWMSARRESTTAVDMATAQIELVLITVHATVVFTETGGHARM